MRTLAKDLSLATPKTKTTPILSIRYVIFKTCHYVEVWKLSDLAFTAPHPSPRRGAPAPPEVALESLWHVTDMPGVQGERRGVALPPQPGRVCASILLLQSTKRNLSMSSVPPPKRVFPGPLRVSTWATIGSRPEFYRVSERGFICEICEVSLLEVFHVFGLIVAGGDCPGFNLWGSSKLPSL